MALFGVSLHKSKISKNELKKTKPFLIFANKSHIEMLYLFLGFIPGKLHSNKIELNE